MSFHDIGQRRSIIDRRSVAAAMQQGDVAAALREALDCGRAEIAQRLGLDPSGGRSAAEATAFLHDQIVRLAFDHVAGEVAPNLALVGLGGTGRGEAAPYSDVDLMVLTKDQPGSDATALAERLFALLWDLKLKLGHSARSEAELIAATRDDMTVRTAFLEARWLWGDQALFESAAARFRKQIVAGTAAPFVAAKLAERDQRHRRMGDSRYVVEPNVKDGKGGLRDLHTLYWIGKYVHGVREPRELVKAGLLSAAEYRRFDRAERFFWSVRCHLHLLAGRPEERLTFDYQQRIAEILQ